MLFAAVQSAYTLLSDDAKRKAYDARSDRQTMRKKPREDRRAAPSTNSFHVPPANSADAKQRDFNRKFYNEYRHAAMNRRPPPPPAPKNTPPLSEDQESSADKNHYENNTMLPPSKPLDLQMTSKSQDTVTLEWRPGQKGTTSQKAKAYELQWRLKSAHYWETSQRLILRATCRKRRGI